jgi:membrane associated rhomboid family serine protease
MASGSPFPIARLVLMFSLPPATQALIAINIVMFLLEGSLGAPVLDALALWPLGPEFRPWQLLSYAFLHENLAHLAINMYGLYLFGSDLERVWGTRRYLAYYVVCALSAALTQIVVERMAGAYAPTVGASGALFGVLLGFAKAFPNRIVMPLIPPIPMRAPVFVALYAGLELVLGVTHTQAGVAHFAHLGGLVGGYLLMRFRR